MSITHTESSPTHTNTRLINLQDRCSMDIRARRNISIPHYRSDQRTTTSMEYRKRLSTQPSGRRLLPSGCFSVESLFLLVCLTATLLILPLILPPLPPPPFLLLLLPIGILAVLMVLAFMPTNARDIASLTSV